MRRGGPVLALALLVSGSLFQPASAQTTDPFVRPPPGRAPGAPPQAPALPTVSIEMLVRQGFEVKAVERGSGTRASYLVILQRSGEIRTCLMQLSSDANRAPRRESYCF